jgi:hypothetical protein
MTSGSGAVNARRAYTAGVALHRDIGGSDAGRADPVERPAGLVEHQHAVRSWRLATGTLACPRCDAPVAPGARSMTPAAPLGCPFCSHAGAVRDFLSLAAPSRPARVHVRVVDRLRTRA